MIDKNPQYKYLVQLAGDMPGVTITFEDQRHRATLTNPNGWKLTLTPDELLFRRPDGAWATKKRDPKKLEHLIRAFSRGNTMGISWQERR